jgi:hypothetical protein
MNSTQFRDNDADDALGDSFENWLRACPPVEPPAALRDRCRTTIPEDICSPSAAGATFSGAALSAAGPGMPNTIWRRSWLKTAVAASFLVASLLVALIVTGERPLLLAEVIAKSQEAPAAHLIDTSSDSERAPGQIHGRQMWVIKGIGSSEVFTVNGKVTMRRVSMGGTLTTWDVEKNEVVIEPTTGPSDGALWLTTLQQLEYLEKQAHEQKVPIEIEKLRVDGRPIERVRIEGIHMRMGESAAVGGSVIDVDPSTKRLLRLAGHGKTVGKERLRYASLNSTTEEVIDYPDPNTIDRSIFHLAYPPSVKVVRHENPAFIRQDEVKLRLLADTIKDYRAEHGDRFPTEWRKDLLPYFRKKGPARPYLTSDETGREKTAALLKDPNYMSWKFEHSGEKYADLTHPDREVIASRAYTGRFQEGYRLVLYATGRIEVDRPAAK